MGRADDFHLRAGGEGDGHVHLAGERILGIGGAAAVHLDGRNTVPGKAVGDTVPRPDSVARLAAGPAASRQRGGMRNLRGGLRLIRRDSRDHRSNVPAGTRRKGI